jgi:hemoglobin
MTTLFEHAGGEDALHRLEEVFCAKVLADPLLAPLFGKGRPEHVNT